MLDTISQTEPTGVVLRPLFVDLDGTLVKSDTLVDSLLVLIRLQPLQVFKLPVQLIHGKAAFKAFVTESISLDIEHLPYNRPLLEFLKQEYMRGRAIFLATGADVMLARRVASHLGIFKDVLGSDGDINLTGNKKLAGIRNRIGDGEFDYIGNAMPDLPVLALAKEPMVANPSLPLRTILRSRGIEPSRKFIDKKGVLASLLSALRPHQWAKNLLIFVPLLLAHSGLMSRADTALLAFCCFSLAASATYIVNDLLDVEADRRHHRKRRRPFAAGDLSALTGLCTVTVFIVVALCAGRSLPSLFFAWLLLYLFSTLAYSLYLKRIAIVDVLVLSGLYTLRLQAGSAATHTPISHWLAGFAVFLFLSLAIVKRFAELENLRASGTPPKSGRGYLLADIEQIRSFGTASAYASVVIFAIYISGPDVAVLYHKPFLLWLIVPLMILWLSRVWLLASRGELDEDPVVFALSDRMSLLIGAAVAAIALLSI